MGLAVVFIDMYSLQYFYYYIIVLLTVLFPQRIYQEPYKCLLSIGLWGTIGVLIFECYAYLFILCIYYLLIRLVLLFSVEELHSRSVLSP